MGDTGVRMMEHRLCRRRRVADESAPETVDGVGSPMKMGSYKQRGRASGHRHGGGGRDASSREAALARRRAPGRPAEQRGRAPLYCFGAGGRSRATRAPGASLAFSSR